MLPLQKIFIREFLKIHSLRYCEGKSPKQSIEKQYSGLLRYARNDKRVFLKLPINYQLLFKKI
jgi:hypothetical protein